MRMPWLASANLNIPKFKRRQDTSAVGIGSSPGQSPMAPQLPNLCYLRAMCNIKSNGKCSGSTEKNIFFDMDWNFATTFSPWFPDGSCYLDCCWCILRMTTFGQTGQTTLYNTSVDSPLVKSSINQCSLQSTRVCFYSPCLPVSTKSQDAHGCPWMPWTLRTGGSDQIFSVVS